MTALDDALMEIADRCKETGMLPLINILHHPETGAISVMHPAEVPAPVVQEFLRGLQAVPIMSLEHPG